MTADRDRELALRLHDEMGAAWRDGEGVDAVTALIASALAAAREEGRQEVKERIAASAARQLQEAMDQESEAAEIKDQLAASHWRGRQAAHSSLLHALTGREGR
jgi:hypothetical protein